MQDIKNIIFDLGGVIINIDYNLTVKAFQKLGIDNFDKIYSQLKQTDLFDKFEVGEVSADEFRAQLLEYMPTKVSIQQIDSAWNALLLDVPPKRIELLSQLSKKYRLFLLSNTNDIHIQEFGTILQQQYGFKDLSHLFEQLYYSYTIGYRKPNKEAFAYVLDSNKLLAQETLFIDDSPQHIEGAKRLGIQTLHLKPHLSINEVFTAEGVVRKELKEQSSIHS